MTYAMIIDGDSIQEGNNIINFNTLMEKLEENCNINMTELSEESKVMHKLHLISGTEAELEATLRISEISKGSKEELRDIMTREYGKLFKNASPGYRCEIIIPQITSNATVGGYNIKASTLDIIVRQQWKDNLFRLVIKKCFNIDTYEIVYDKFGIVERDQSNMDADQAEFKSQQQRMLLYGCPSTLTEAGYKISFIAVIE